MICRLTKMIMRFLVILLFTVAGLLVIGEEVSAQGGDSDPPVVDLSSITVTPDEVEVGDEVTFRVNVTDHYSCIYNVQVRYRSPSGSSTRDFVSFYDDRL